MLELADVRELHLLVGLIQVLRPIFKHLLLKVNDVRSHIVDSRHLLEAGANILGGSFLEFLL